MKSILKFTSLFALVGALIFVSCKEDEPAPPKNALASFDVIPDTENFLKVQFVNASQNAVSYAWQFGDNTASTESDPVKEYDAPGTYLVKLIATGENGSEDEFEKEVIITDPDEKLTLLAGAVSKDWKLMRTGNALGIGPDAENFDLWFALANDGSRNCFFDDVYTFRRDGGFEYNDGGTFWGEGDAFAGTDKADLAETCFEATEDNLTIDGVDKSAWLSSTSHTYTYDANGESITLNGEGAWMSLIKLGTSGYVTEPQASTTVGAFVIDGGDSGVDTLEIHHEYAALDNYWVAKYVSYSDPATQEPPLAGAQPTASFEVTVDGNTITCTNNSSNADTYAWDFGDDAGTSTDENPTYTYAANGVYVVKLTSTNANGSAETTRQVVIGDLGFTPADLIGTWKILPEAGAIGVGPGSGDISWWSNTLEDVTTRACYFDDTFTFADAGVFDYEMDGSTWVEPWQGTTPDACGTPVAPHDGLGSYTYEATNISITVNGAGAFLGVAKAHNNGEFTADDDWNAVTSRTYTLTAYDDSGATPIMTIEIDYNDGAGFWTYKLQKQ